MRTKKLKLSEESLIRTLREAHPNGMRALYDMYSLSLFDKICRIVPDKQLSEDILQETFVKIWRSFQHYDAGKGRLFTWMVNIARNLALDRLRSRSYKRSLALTGLDSCEENMVPADAETRLDGKLVRQGVTGLRYQERSVLDLVYFQGYTHVEAAERLAIPVGTLKTRLSMAIRNLRNYYDTVKIAS